MVYGNAPRRLMMSVFLLLNVFLKYVCVFL